jgi:hypothetical protein
LKLLRPSKLLKPVKVKLNKTSIYPRARLRYQRSKKTWRQSATSSFLTAPLSRPDCYKVLILSRSTLSTNIASRHTLKKLKNSHFLKRSDVFLMLTSKYTGVRWYFVFDQLGALGSTAFLYSLIALFASLLFSWASKIFRCLTNSCWQTIASIRTAWTEFLYMHSSFEHKAARTGVTSF